MMLKFYIAVKYIYHVKNINSLFFFTNCNFFFLMEKNSLKRHENTLTMGNFFNNFVCFLCKLV
jgi:hypothetical protein